jgi:ABC-type Fe3+-hydroxamate transport system substrate-binding protein
MNTEMILKLNPDLIIAYPEHRNKLKIIRDNIELLIIRHITITDILRSIMEIGDFINKRNEAVILVKSLKEELYKKQKKNGKKKVLFIVGRNYENLQKMTIIGNKGFLNELLELSGGENAYKGNIPYPSVSIESVAAMNPEIIFELSFHNEEKKQRNIFYLWKKYPMINAVKNKKIHFLTEDYWQIPGPRISKIVKKLRKLIN